MRINFYEARLSEDDRIILVKDKAVNYKAEKLNAPDKIAKMMRELLHMGKMAEEYCYMIALSSACRILGIFFISKGTVNATLITPRELYIWALLAGAVHVILCHNHPSGNVMPSDEDIEVTNRVKKAGDLVEVKLVDHIIIAGDSYYSFKEDDRL